MTKQEKQIKAAYEKARERFGVRAAIKNVARDMEVSTATVRHALGFTAPGEERPLDADAILFRLVQSLNHGE